MKKFFYLFVALGITGAAITSCDTTTETPQQYHNTVYNAADTLYNFVFDLQDALSYGEDQAEAQAAYDKLMEHIGNSSKRIEGKNDYKGFADLYTASNEMITFYNDFSTEHFPPLVDLVGKDSLTYDDYDHIDETFDVFFEEEEPYLDALDDASGSFYDTHPYEAM